MLGTAVTWWVPSGNYIDQSSYKAAQIVTSDNSPAQILVAGRSGVWRSAATSESTWAADLLPAVLDSGLYAGHVEG